MASRYKFYENVIDTNDNSQMKGLLSDPTFANNFFTTGMFYFTIPIGLQYRPDLIAYRFFRDASLDWVLTYVNNFTNSPEDYYTGNTILIPELNRIKQVV